MNKIEWCDMTWNPVWGCLTGCEYCYANHRVRPRHWKQIYKKEVKYWDENFPDWKLGKDKNNKLYKNLKNFIPDWIESNFVRKFPKKVSKWIFVNSMSDIRWWEPEWRLWVLDRIKEYPQHIFVFLTKFPETYSIDYFSKNCWLGVTITKNSEMEKLESFDYFFDPNYRKTNLTYVSFEPLLERIDMSVIKKHQVDWVIVGAETGNRKDKVVPKWGWISDIYVHCQKHKIPLFIKDNVYKSWGLDPKTCAKVQQFPEDKK